MTAGTPFIHPLTLLSMTVEEWNDTPTNERRRLMNDLHKVYGCPDFTPLPLPQHPNCKTQLAPTEGS